MNGKFKKGSNALRYGKAFIFWVVYGWIGNGTVWALPRLPEPDPTKTTDANDDAELAQLSQSEESDGEEFSPSSQDEGEEEGEGTTGSGNLSHWRGMVGLEPLGFHPQLGYGMVGSGFLSAHIAIQLHYARSFTSKVSSDRFWMGSLLGQFFLTNTSYFAAGLGVRKSAEATNVILISGRSETREITNLGIQVGAGSQWQWVESPWSFGIQWLGIYLPVKALKHTYQSKGISSQLAEKNQRDFEKEKGKPALSLTRFWIAYLF